MGKQDNGPINEWPNPILRIVLVMGPSGCGKSTYIANSGLVQEAYEVFDIWQYQESSSYPANYPESLKIRLSYAFLEHEVSQGIRNAYSMERAMRDAIDAHDIEWAGVREPELIVIEGTYLKAARRADLIQDIRAMAKNNEVVFDCICVSNDRARRDIERELLEVPTIEEGFSSITLIGDFELTETIEEIETLTAYIKERDRIKEGGYFELPV